MIPLRIHEVGGMMPAWDERFLPDNQASFAENTFLYSGAMMGWRKPKLLRALNNSTAKYAYRIPTITRGVATANLAFISNPLEGDTVSLGEVNYHFTATPTNSYDVLLGSTATKSAQNLFLALNFGAQDTAICGIATLQNPAIATANPYLGFPFSATAATATPGADTMVLVKVIPSGTQKLNSISFLPAGSSSTAKFKGVIYNNVNSVQVGGSVYVDNPSTLITTGAEIIGCNAGTEVDSPLTVPVTLIGGETYWIGFLMDTAVSFARASDTNNSISFPNAYTSGPINPVTGTGVSFNPITGAPLTGPTISTGGPNYQIWGNMSVITSTDPENIIGSNDFGTGQIPYIAVYAPDFGAAYNTTAVNEGTSGSRMAWVSGLDSLSNLIGSMTGGINPTVDTSILGVSQWLEFADQFTNVVKSPVVDDSFQRYYFVSPTQPPEYNTYDRIVNNQQPFLLGVPAPGCPPTVSVGGGGLSTQLGFPTSTSSNKASFTAGQMYLTKVTPPSTVGLSDISMAIQSSAGFQGAALFLGVVYDDNNGAPGNLLATAVAAAQPASLPATVTSSFTVASGLVAGASYWIGAVFAASGEVQLADDTGTAGAIANTSFASTGQPPTTGAGSVQGQQNWQIWGDEDTSSSNTTDTNTSNSVIESRAYVYTWVTEYGEEGPPSPPTLADGWTNGIWTIGVFSPLADEMGITRNIVQTNLYRTVSGTNGQTTYFFVASFDVSQGTYVDVATDNIVAENLELPSTNWFPPPEELEGIEDMPNGMLVGFKSNELWFCEPYRPHAWPPAYVLTTEFPIVGIAVSGQSVVACTNSSPAVATGARPDVMSLTKLNFPEPCNSRGSIISTSDSVYYTSPNGLIKVSGNQATNVSQSWVTREKWTKYTPQKDITAIPLMGSYFALGTGVDQRGFTMELSSTTDSQGFGNWPQIGGHRLGLQVLTPPNGYNVDNLMLDPWSSVALLVQNLGVYYYDFEDQAPEIIKYRWRSKKYQTPHKDSFAVMKLWFDIPPGGPQTPPKPATYANPSFTPQVNLPYAAGMFGVVRVIADGVYVMEREIRKSEQFMRIPDGFKASTWQWEVEGIVTVTVIKAATSAKELGQGSVGGRE